MHNVYLYNVHPTHPTPKLLKCTIEKSQLMYIYCDYFAEEEKEEEEIESDKKYIWEYMLKYFRTIKFKSKKK